jgi:hypothetical protein
MGAAAQKHLLQASSHRCRKGRTNHQKTKLWSYHRHSPASTSCHNLPVSQQHCAFHPPEPGNVPSGLCSVNSQVMLYTMCLFGYGKRSMSGKTGTLHTLRHVHVHSPVPCIHMLWHELLPQHAGCHGLLHTLYTYTWESNRQCLCSGHRAFAGAQHGRLQSTQQKPLLPVPNAVWLFEQRTGPQS